MKTKTYATVSYVNFEIEVNVFSILNKKIRMLYSTKITKIDLKNNISAHDSSQIIQKMKKAFDECRENNIDISNTYLLIDNIDFYTENQKIKYDFENEKFLDVNDLEKVCNLSRENANPKDDFTFIDSKIRTIVLDEQQKVIDPINKKAHNITLQNELIFVDFHIYSKLKNFVIASAGKLTKTLSIPLEISEAVGLQDGEATLQLGLNQLNFTINQNDMISRFNVELGFKNFIEDIYEQLETREVKNPQEVTFFIKNYFPLKKYGFKNTIFDSIEIDEVIEMLQKIIIGYFDYILKEITKKGINIKKYYLIFDEFLETELIELLDKTFGTKFVSFEEKLKEMNVNQKKIAVSITNYHINSNMFGEEINE